MFNSLIKQTLPTIRSRVKACSSCVFGSHTKDRVPGFTKDDVQGPKLPIMLVSDYPGDMEEKKHIPLIGPTGELFKKMIMEKLGPHLDIKFEASAEQAYEYAYVTNIMKCIPRRFVIDKVKKDKPRPTEIKQCSKHLIAEIQVVKPKVILASGMYAIKTLIGAKDLPIYREIRMKRFPCTFDKDIDVLCTMNAAAILHAQREEGEAESDKRLIQFEEDVLYFVNHLRRIGVI